MNDLWLVGVIVLLILLLVPMKPPQPVVTEQLTSWREQFARDVLSELGNRNPTTDTVRVIVLWTYQEDTTDGAWNRNNPLNTTLCTGRDTGACSDPVRATVDTITNGLYNDIIFGLQNNSSCYAIIQSIKLSPWAESRYPNWEPRC